MEPMPGAPYVEPNSRIPKVLGILNIVFASMLMICGLCSVFYVSMIPVWAQAVDKIQQDVEAQEDKKRKTELEEIAAAEKEAKTDDEKAEVEARRKDVGKAPRPPMVFKMDLKATGLMDRRMRIYVWAEFLSGVVLNLLMLASGVGLVMHRMWGLKLGLSVAALKVVRLVLVYGYAAVVIVPLLSQGFAKFQIQAVAQQQQAMGKPMPPGFTVENLTKGMSVWFASCAVAMILVGSVYPVISLWLLSRPGARAACSADGKSMGTDETW